MNLLNKDNFEALEGANYFKNRHMRNQSLPAVNVNVNKTLLALTGSMVIRPPKPEFPKKEVRK